MADSNEDNAYKKFTAIEKITDPSKKSLEPTTKEESHCAEIYKTRFESFYSTAALEIFIGRGRIGRSRVSNEKLRSNSHSEAPSIGSY